MDSFMGKIDTIRETCKGEIVIYLEKDKHSIITPFGIASGRNSTEAIENAYKLIVKETKKE